MKNISFILGLLSAILILEILFRQKAEFPAPLTDNNSFIIKKENFDDYLKTHSGNLSEKNIFLGSSFFARGIDCQKSAELSCLNLSLDGGDSSSYDQTYERLIKGTRPKRIILELTPIVLAEYDYSGPAIKGYLDSPVDHLKAYSTQGLTADFKQSLKNQVDAELIGSGLNFFSRRNRFAEWPRIIEKKWGVEQPKATTPAVEEISSYFNPQPEKLDLLENLVGKLNQQEIEVVIIATPERYEGVLDSEALHKSHVYKLLSSWHQEGKIRFIFDLTKKGLGQEALADELNHLGRDKLDLLAQILKREIEGAP